MKRILPALFNIILAASATAQISPDSYSVEHKDSNWYVTLDYEIEKMPSKEGMVLISHICTPDTCITSAAKHFQGKKFAKQQIKKYGYAPTLHSHGNNSCTFAVPEKIAGDTLLGVTYCEYINTGNETSFALDTMEIVLPACPALCCHRVDNALTIADHIAKTHPYVKSIRHYTPLDENSEVAPHSKQIVRYYTNSPLLDIDYMNNSANIDELMSVISRIMSDSATTVEAIQIAGYTSPETAEKNSAQLGYRRAIALRDHIRKHHHLPDSLFEIADTRHNWQQIYKDIAMLDAPDGDSLITALKNEPSPTKREMLLQNYKNGMIYNELAGASFAKHRGAAINAIYYSNSPDSAAITINNIVNELINNPTPDYHALARQLKQYKNDARAINLQGVIDYRRHRRHAAEEAFKRAAGMGDKQAAANLMIVQAEHH